MKINICFEFGSYALICGVALFLFALHAQGQAPQGSKVLNSPTSSNMNSTTEIVSSIPNVTVTKFEILAPKSMALDLKYSGGGKSPAVMLESSTMTINSKVEEIASQINSLKDNSTSLNASSSATSLIAELDKLGEILSSSNGTKTLDAGWKSPKSVKVKLTGNTTLNDAQFIGVVVR
jgi:hypothetical protein